jgi:hypothetical protein
LRIAFEQPHGAPVPGQWPIDSDARVQTMAGMDIRSTTRSSPHSGQGCAADRSATARRRSKAALQFGQEYS